MLSGENGILKKAGDAKELTGIGQEKEIVALAYNSALAKKVSNGDSSEVTAGDLNTELTNQGASADGSNPITVTFTDSKRQYTINSNGIIEYAGTKNGDEITGTGINILEFSIAGKPVTDVSLPSSDFEKVSGTEIDNSYVARGKAGTDYEGDEFVWVPVDKEQEFTVKIEGSGNIASVVLTNPVGDTKVLANNITAPQNLTGITPTVEGNVYNGEYKVTVTPVEGETSEKTLDVYSLYAFNVKFYFEAMKNSMAANFSNIPAQYIPAGVTTSDEYLNYVIQQQGGIKGVVSSYSEPTDSDIDYATRVASNGGFWIGRYEASYNGETEKAASKKSTSSRTSFGTDLSNGMLWNRITRSNALTTAKEYNNILKSSLPTGAAWDRTLGWIYEKRNSTGKSLEALTANSASWGNYSDDTLTNGSNSLINTGSTNETIANNIYDLAGNLGEWSTENDTQSSSPVVRGGDYTDSSMFGPAMHLSGGSEGSFDNGFRLVLYK